MSKNMLIVLLVAACSLSRSSTSTPKSGLVFLTRDGCVNSSEMLANLDAALRALHRAGDYQVIDQGTLSSTDVRTGYPTPTLLYANRDLFGMLEPKPPYPEPT